MKWTDEQCWQIWCVIEPDPEEQKGPTRQMAIDYIRKWLGPWWPGANGQISALESLAVHLDDADRRELADRVRKLAQDAN